MATAIPIFGILLFLRFIHKVLVDLIPRILTKPSLEEITLAANVKEQKRLIQLIDAQNEFAKFAKLQRKIKKWEDELSNKATERQKQGLKTTGILWLVSMILSGCFHFWLIWTYKGVAVVHLPRQWLYPLSGILKYPTAIDGAVGLPCWLLVCNSVLLLLQSF